MPAATGVTSDSDDVVEALNVLLRGELAAIESYDKVLQKGVHQPLRAVLLENERSHQERATRLRSMIVQLGGSPSLGPGAWGGLARIVQGGAKAFGLKAGLAVLQEGEDHGVRLYQNDLDKLDPATRLVVEGEFLGLQTATRDTIAAVRQAAND